MDLLFLIDWLGTLFITISILFYINYKWNRRRFESMADKLPAANTKTLPFIGNCIFNKNTTNANCSKKRLDSLLSTVKDNDQKLGRFWLGPYLFVMLCRLEDVEAVLTNSKITNKSFMFSFFNPLMRGAIVSQGEEWKCKRRSLSKMFQPYLMERYIEIFNEQGAILVDHLTEKSKLGVFDVSPAFGRCTLDIICRTAFGVRMYIQNDESVTVPDDLKKATRIVLQRMFKPWMYPEFIFKMTKAGKEMLKYTDSVHQFVLKVIRKRRDIIERFKMKNKNGVQNTGALCKNMNEEDEKETAPYLDALLEQFKEENLNDQQLAAEMVDVVAGGMDTSAVADSYVLLLLAIYKDWQDKIHKEIDDIFGNSDRPVTVDDLGKLVYLEMVIKEVLRLYSPQHSVRFLTDDIKVGKFTLPAGAFIYTNTYVIHRDKTYWSNPNKFHPDHFLPESVHGRPKCSYLPFSAGLRGCPGSRYAMMSMKILLTLVLRKFKVKTDLKFKEMKCKPVFMLELVGGYPIELVPRVSCS